MYKANHINTFHREPMDGIKIKVSRLNRAYRASNFKHKNYEYLPSLFYMFDIDGLSCDKVHAAPEIFERLLHWQNNYWDNKAKNGKTNQKLYEQQLFEAVTNAIDALDEKWTKRFVSETNKKFGELL